LFFDLIRACLKAFFLFIFSLIDFKQSNTKKSTTCLNKLIIQEDKISNISSSSSTSSLNNIWISLQTNNNSTENRIEFKNNQLNSCDFNLKPFTKIESNLNKLIIEYETNNIDDIEKQEAPFNFLLLISAVNEDTEKIEENDLCNNLDQDLKCNTNYYDPARQHTVCLPKNLVCNCDLFLNQSDYKCYNLVQYINESSLINEKINCYYFLKLNNMCQNQQEFKNSEDTNNDQEVDETVSNNDQFKVNYDEDDSSLVSDKTKLNSIVLFKNEKKQIENICINQTLTNEYGWISSPDFGGLKRTYSSGLNCFYHVSFQPNQIVQLRFKYFYLFSNLVELTNDNNKSKRSDSFRTYDLDETAIYLSNHKKFKSADASSSDIKSKPLPFALGRSLDYDYLNIYDGSTTDAPLIAHLTSIHNDFNRNFNGRVFNSKSNNLLIQFHSTKSPPPPSLPPPLPPTLFNRNESYKIKRNKLEQPQMGFNLTYQIKGLCIEDQTPCNSLYELNCYSRNQTCNDVWDCHNGADERGCGPCKPDQFRCRNHIFCYKLEDRCDGDHQCIDKSDELNCDPWFCNADNGTFLCQNGRCVYEQWVCDGANDCDDGSDEMNCPTPFTRRVITTAVLGGTLCCLLLVMALGCACKLYSLHTVGYRNNIRLTQSVQSAAAVAAAAASVPLITPSYPSSLANPSVSTTMTNLASSFSSTTPQPPSSSSAVSEPIVNPTTVDLLTPTTTTTNNNNTSTGSMIYNNLATLFRRALTNSTNNQLPINLENTNTNVLNSGCEIISTQQLNNNQLQPGELPQPHYLIAPPTYNQTMGLVDEYEQRQLAFIEHVRSILLAQQQSNQQQNAGQLINLNTNNNNNTTSSTNQNGLIPTATSSSTILHRVSNSSGGGSSSGRRSHSSRHHRHSNHHNRSSSNNIEAASVITNQILANNNSSSNNSDALTNSGRISHSRRHHHHHHHNHHRHHRSTNNHALMNTGGFLSTNNNANQISNSLSQVNFDSNRRGLIINNQESSNPPLSSAILQSQLQRRRSCGLSSSNSSNFGGGTSSGSSQQQQQLDQLQMQPTGSSQVTSSSEPNSLATNPTNSFNSTVIKSQSNSINLRDRIAKLIKDIVVHHGDNIQYVPLANGNANSLANTILTANNNNNNNNIVESISMTNSPNENNNQTTITTPQPPTTTTQLSTSSNVSQNGSEDDVPLIQPF